VRAQFEQAGITPITLTPGSGGVFDISVDAKLVFSKQQVGRFPTEAEVADIISACAAH